MKTEFSNRTCKRLRASGLSRDTTLRALDQINQWLDSNGPAWTIARLKMLKQGYVNKLAGADELFPRDSWIKTSKKGTPTGPFAEIFKLKKPQKALSALMVYSQFVSKKVIPSQLTKFIEAVNSAEVKMVDVASDSEHEWGVAAASAKMLHQYNPGEGPVKPRFGKVTTWANRKVRVPLVETDPNASFQEIMDGTANTVRTVEAGHDPLVKSASHPLAWSFFEGNQTEIDFPDDITSVMASAAMRPEDYSGVENIVGTIGLIQEPGFKLRTIANPYPIFQVLLSRMGEAVYQTLERVNEDATFDQDSAVLDIQNAMRDGVELMSIDLSSATDRFPLDFTLRAMVPFVKDGLFTKAELDLWSEISRSDWKMPKRQSPNTVCWGNGQPLGVYPSFGAFAWSHHVLARMADPTFYRILGDDIVIDREAGIRLRARYSELGLLISEDKSIDSSVLAEFGGRLITKRRILTQPKWRDISDRSFVDMIRALGPKGLGLLPPRQRKVIQLLAEVPKELCSFGLNWNPHGKPYAQRVKESQEIISALTNPQLEYLTNKNLADAMDSLKLTISMREYSDFKGVAVMPPDEALVQPVPIWDIDSRILQLSGSTNVEFESDDLPVRDWVPHEEHISDPRGLTTLEVLERKLKGVKKPK